MTDINDILARSKEARYRLRHPPNPVPDTGINLVRGRAVPRATIESDQKEDLQPSPEGTEAEPAPALPPPHKPIPLTFQSTLQITAKAFNMTVDEIRAVSRKTDVVRPRQIAIYLASQYNRKSVSWIGEQLNLDHTTVLHSIKRIEQLMEEIPSLRALVDDLGHKITTLYLPPVAAHYEPHLGAWKEWDVSQRVLSPMDQGG